MQNNFSMAEESFVKNGGNLWYVERIPDDGWNIIRWSEWQGHCVIMPAIRSEMKAEQWIWEFVRPSSSRTRTVIFHGIPRPDRVKEALFPRLS